MLLFWAILEFFDFLEPDFHGLIFGKIDFQTLYSSFNAHFKGHVCSGVIINRFTIITAAHCLLKSKKEYYRVKINEPLGWPEFFRFCCSVTLIVLNISYLNHFSILILILKWNSWPCNLEDPSSNPAQVKFQLLL